MVSDKNNLQFTYDVNGNRNRKIEYLDATHLKITYYTTDASGNSMAIYTRTRQYQDLNLYALEEEGNVPNGAFSCFEHVRHSAVEVCAFVGVRL